MQECRDRSCGGQYLLAQSFAHTVRSRGYFEQTDTHQSYELDAMYQNAQLSVPLDISKMSPVSHSDYYNKPVDSYTTTIDLGHLIVR
jgi:hypothetical protein